MGQERPCFYYWMICPGTVEESIFSTLRRRKDYNDELFRNTRKATQRAKRNQWFRRMFTVALLMGLVVGFFLGRFTAHAFGGTEHQAALEFGLQYYDVYLKEGADNDQM